MRSRLASVACALAGVGPFCSLEPNAQAAPPWVDRPLTLPSGDWSFDFGLGVGHVPDHSGAGINAELAVGLTSRIELGVRTGIQFGDGLERSIHGDDYGRVFDRQTFDEGSDALANPELRVRGALVRERVIELALEGRLVLPFADGTGAGMLLGMPLAFHLGQRVRLDTGVYVPLVFPPRDSTYVTVGVPLDVWIQCTSRLWLGPMTGVSFGRIGDGPGPSGFGLSQPAFDPNGNRANVSLGFGLGYQAARIVDLKAMFLFPAINNDSRDFGVGGGVEIRIE